KLDKGLTTAFEGSKYNPRSVSSDIKSTLCSSNAKKGLLSISALILYITAARSLQGTAQSAQLQSISMYDHWFGVIFKPFFSAKVNNVGSNSLLNNLEINKGFSASLSIKSFKATPENSGSLSCTL